MEKEVYFKGGASETICETNLEYLKINYQNNGSFLIKNVQSVYGGKTLFVYESTKYCVKNILFNNVSNYGFIIRDIVLHVSNMDKDESDYWNQRISEINKSTDQSIIDNLIDDLTYRCEKIMNRMRSSCADTKPINHIKFA